MDTHTQIPLWRSTQWRAWGTPLLILGLIAAGCGNNDPGTSPGTTNPGTDMMTQADMPADMTQPADMMQPTDMMSPVDMMSPADMSVDMILDMIGDMADDMNGDMAPDIPADMGPSCQDECMAGAQTCDGTNGYRLCGQYDQDPCLELSPTVSCTQGFSCDVGRCVQGCRDTCELGGTLCLDEQTVQVCGNFDTDACLESGGNVTCGSGERCEVGQCVPQGQACSDECAMNGQTVCLGDAVRTCGEFDSDSCLDLGIPVACASGESCGAGVCAPTCTDTCPMDGATQCSGDGVSTCSDTNNDGCLEWATPSACASGESCNDGVCRVGACMDECSGAGAPTCSPDGSGVNLCGQYDSDTCLDRSSAIPCPLGFGCQNGLCIATCTNECTSGTSRCGQDSASLETCGNFDSDPCLEFGGNVACPGNADCSNNACQVPCSDECTTNGQTECAPGNNATRTCGQFDLDACLEWSTEATCESYEVCTTGSCELGATPASLLINELSYDSQGRDSDPDNTLFVELWGPAGTSLEGWSLVSINGADGAVSSRIDLSGEVIANDGYFIIAHPQAHAALLADADITDTKVDYQNGPDAVQLQWQDRIVDALGYGVFGAGTTFGGEGTAATSSVSGGSLSRDANHTDTDDNSADFSALTIPTPRNVLLGCQDECIAQGNAQCVGDDVQTCGNYDADSCLEWSTATACATAGEVCQSGQCLPPCSNECSTQGDTQCLGDQVITCGDYDADSCLEWSVPVDCPDSGDSCVVNICQSLAAPEVIMITPQGTTQSTQGNSHRILVDPTPSAGRTIARVDFYANAMLIGSTMATPHEVTYIIPAATPTNSIITIQAKAIDQTGEVGVSTLAYLDVRNDVPVAAFNATITNTTTATVDASGSTDTETSINDLEVCWDWNDDGTCDTPFSTTKIQTHDFGASGIYTIRMKVRDAQGQTTETTRQVSFQDIQYLGGTDIMTTLWYGTIIVTGDLRIPAGQTLTIAAGTQVLFVNADVEAPMGVGDYTLNIEGALVVNGTAAAPVVFSGQDISAKVPGGWDRILVGGSGSSITHAIIEYGDVGLELKSDVALEHVTVRKALNECVLLNNADNASLTDVSISECGTHGVHALSGSTGITATRLSSVNNGEHGVYIDENSTITIVDTTLTDNGADGAHVSDGSMLSVSDGIIEDNTARGIAFTSNSGGTVTQNQIRSNGAEGVGMFSDAGGVPTPVVHYNNIYSNAVTGSTTVEEVTVSGIAAGVSTYYSANDTSSNYTEPAGRQVKRVYVTYTETTYRCSGQLRNQNNSSIQSFSSNFAGWIEVGIDDTAFSVYTSKTSGGSGSCDISITKSELLDSIGSDDVVSVTSVGTIDARFNYLGAFPDVLSRVGESRSDALNLQGYVGVLFDTTTWSRGPYVGGESESGMWSGTVYVTGDVDVDAGETLDVAPGTQIQVIKHDQDGDGEGDWTIQANGELNLNGALGNEVVISAYGTALGDIFQGFILGGTSTSAWTDVTLGSTSIGAMTGATVGVTVLGASSMTRVDIAGGSSDGLRTSGSGAILTSVSVDSAGGDGVWLRGSPTLVRVDVRRSGRHGIHITDGSTAVIEDSTIRDNIGDGVHVQAASPSLNYNIITYNGAFGVNFYGNSAGTSEYNVVKFNNDAGLGLFSDAGGAPTPTFQRSNVYGNSVIGATTIEEVTVSGIAAGVSTYYSANDTSSNYTEPAGRQVKRVYVTYTETTYRCSGQLRNQNNSSIQSFSSNFAGWIEVGIDDTAFSVYTSKTSGGSGSCDISITKSELLDSSMNSYELVAFTSSGTALAKFNYWTPSIGSVPTRIFESRNGSVDYTGFVGAEYATAGPRAAP